MAKPIKLKQGKSALTAGVVQTPTLAFCHADGSITVTWRSNGLTKVIPATAGRSFDMAEVESVSVTTGTWSFE